MAVQRTSPMACILLHTQLTEATVHVEDLEIAPGKIGETAQRIIDRAIEEARRREPPAG